MAVAYPTQPAEVSALADHHTPALDAASRRRRGAAEYEIRVLTIPPSTSRGDVHRLLTEEAEYGRWELARTCVYVGGLRKVWLRRRIIRAVRTLPS